MKKRLFVVLILVVLLFSSCSTLSSWMRSNIEGLPFWVYGQSSSKSQISVVGSGQSDNETKARILAYESVLKQISDLIGEDVTTTHLAELTRSNSINLYRLKISQEFVRKGEKETTVWLLATAERSLIEQARTSAELLLLEIEKEIQAYDKQAAQYYRENKDLLALASYIKIATLTTERSKYSFDDYINKIKKILQKLTISISATKEDIPTSTITLRRGSRRLSARIKEAPVTAFYTSTDPFGEPYKAADRFVTDNNGQFIYKNLSPTLMRSGEICFEADIREQLEALKAIDEAVYEELIEIVKEKRVCFSYNRETIISNNALLLSIGEYSIKGELLSSTNSSTAIKEYLKESNINIYVAEALDVDEQEYLEIANQEYPLIDYLLYGNIGITQIKEGELNNLVAVSGTVNLINKKTSSVVGTTENISAIGIGSNLEEAQEQAFYRLGLIATSLINRFLYR